MPESSEEWRAIPGHDGYEASNYGRIRSIARTLPCRSRAGYMTMRRYPERVLAGCAHSNGYLTVHLPANDGYRHLCVNRLVFGAFVRQPADNEEVDHINRVRSDNRATNLRVLSVAANRALRDPMRGEANPAAKLTEIKVRAIRAASGSESCVAQAFGVSRSLVGLVRRRQVWAHVQ
jgi:hypothetical protein